MGWSDQERHGSGWAKLSKDWLPIMKVKIAHCTLSIVLYPGSAACYSVESGIEPSWLQFIIFHLSFLFFLLASNQARDSTLIGLVPTQADLIFTAKKTFRNSNGFPLLSSSQPCGFHCFFTNLVKKRVKEFSMLQPTQRKMQIVNKRRPRLFM